MPHYMVYLSQANSLLLSYALLRPVNYLLHPLIKVFFIPNVVVFTCTIFSLHSGDKLGVHDNDKTHIRNGNACVYDQKKYM